MQDDKKMTAPVIYSIAVPLPRGLARRRGGPRSGSRAMALHSLHGSPAAARAADPRPEPPVTVQGGLWGR